jgi:Replication-relaxation
MGVPGDADTRSRVPLLDLLGSPASPALIERLAQYFSFQQLLRTQSTIPLARRTTRLSRYVGDSLQEEARHLLHPQLPTRPEQAQALRQATMLLCDDAHGSGAERTYATVLVSLGLSRTHKAILGLLLRHPWLCVPDLLEQITEGKQDRRLMQRPLDWLRERGLVHRVVWPDMALREEQERYALTELAVRLLARRHNVPVTRYLRPAKQRETAPGTHLPWEQPGARGLVWQRRHTCGLYRCVRQLCAGGRSTGAYHIAAWYSAHEASRRFYDPFAGAWTPVYPDAELVYVTAGSSEPVHVLLEYDAGTTSGREYRRKFAAYAGLQQHKQVMLPPILVVLQRAQAQAAMRRAMAESGAYTLRVVMVLEEDLVGDGLVATLTARR